MSETRFSVETFNGVQWCIAHRLYGTRQAYFTAKSSRGVHVNKDFRKLLKVLKEKSQGSAQHSL